MKSKKKSWFYTKHFGFIKARLNNIKDYMLEIESKFESDIDRLRKKLDDELKKKPLDPESERYLIDFYAEDYQIINKIFLSTFRYSVLVSVYSMLVSEMNSLCRYLKNKKDLTLELSDLKGDGIKRAKLYLKKVCHVEVPDKTNSWSNIQKLNDIRNCIVHAEGNVDSTHSPGKIKNIVKNTKGLKLVDKRHIHVEKEYLEDIILSVEDLLEQLCKKAFV